MLSGEHSGEWYLPGGKKFPGQLIINNKKETIILEIFGAEFIEGVTIDPPNTYPHHFHSVILGDNITATLYNCHWLGCSEIGKNLYRITYRIEYVFTGVHFKNPELTVRYGSFIFSHLATWFDGDEFHDKLKGKQGLYINGEHVAQDMLKTDEIKINDELTIYFQDKVRESIDKTDTSYKVLYEKFTHFQYSVDKPFAALLKDAVTFLKLLSFCFGKPMNFFIVYVGADRYMLSSNGNDYLNDKAPVQVHVNNYTLKKGKKIEIHSYHSRHMALSGETCSREEMKQIIINWFANEKFYNIYEYYLDSNNWMQGTKARLSNIMFNNRFLNLIQGLEDYFRENFETALTQADRQEFERKKSNVLKSITDPAVKKWLNNTFKFTGYPTLEEKLTKIVTETSEDLSKLFEGISIDWFAKSATQFRHKLSHGMAKEINLGRELHRDYHTAQVLLGVCILRSLGVAKLKERVAYYSRFEDAANEIYLFQKKP